MKTNSAILFTILATTIFVSARSDDPYRVELLKPRGFRVLRPGTPSIRKVEFISGSINSLTEGPRNRILYNTFDRRGDGWWVYENTNTHLDPGDTLFYTVGEFSGWYGVMSNKEFRVPFIDAPQVPAQYY